MAIKKSLCILKRIIIIRPNIDCWKSSLGIYPWNANPCVFIPAFPKSFRFCIPAFSISAFSSLHFPSPFVFVSLRFSIPAFCKIVEMSGKKSSYSEYFLLLSSLSFDYITQVTTVFGRYFPMLGLEKRDKNPGIRIVGMTK